MKICEFCGEKPANVFIRSQTGKQVTDHYLCPSCAAKIGGFVMGVEGLKDLLKELGIHATEVKWEEGEDVSCPVCGTGFRAYRKSGSLGCPSCYDAFSDLLLPLLTRIHGANRHVNDNNVQGENDEVSGDILRVRLLAAISAENYEEAAKIRDCIQVLESGEVND